MGCLGENDVLDFVEGCGAPQARAAVAEHLDECSECRELVAHTARALLPTANDGGQRKASDGLPDRGDLIGRYRVTGRLGRGAMGLVLAAEHVDLRRRVALKVVLPDADRRDADSQLRARLVREARAASAIHHPNVVRVHDVIALDDGSPVMVMDLLEGETLRARLERERSLPAAEALTVARQLLDGLAAAHALGVVHRDLKPDNVFLASEGAVAAVKIVDFGIAKLTAIDGPAAETAGLTQTGMLVGTPHYMAPEQAFNDGPIDARADLWALGVILYECLTGARPFEGDNVGQVLRRLAKGSFRPVEELAPEAPPALCAVVDHLLCERDLRPASAAAVAELLEGSPEGADLAPSSRGRARRAQSAASISADGVAVTRSRLRAPGERSWLLAAGAAAALAVVAFVTWPRGAEQASVARVERHSAEAAPHRSLSTVEVPAPTSPAAPERPVTRSMPRTHPSAAPAAPPPSSTSSGASGPARLITKPPF